MPRAAARVAARGRLVAMRILAMSDLHGFPEVYEAVVTFAREHGPDAVVLAGDLLRPLPGGETLFDRFLAGARWMSEALDGVLCPVYYIMGNDDLVEWDAPQERFRSVHGRRLEQGGYGFVGYQFSLPFREGIYEKPEEEVEVDLAALENLVDERTVLVTHMPAWSDLDIECTWPAGSRSLLRLIEERKPRVHIHGHLHSRFGRDGVHFNVSSGGKLRGMLIDLEDLSHVVQGG